MGTVILMCVLMVINFILMFYAAIVNPSNIASIIISGISALSCQNAMLWYLYFEHKKHKK